MYKIYGSTREKIRDVVAEMEDPYIIDVRKIKDSELKEFYLRDYTHLGELSDRGITDIYLRSPFAGKMRLMKFLQRAKDYDREVVILYDNEKHYQYIRRKINEWTE